MKNPSYIQINIPQPCHEDWTQMTSQQQGRFCDSCQKCVVDFTNYTDTELHRFLQEHQGEKVCGRFKNTQLNRAINIPPQPHSTIYKWIVAAGLALVISAVPNSPTFAQAPVQQEQLHEVPFVQNKKEVDTSIITDPVNISGNVLDERKEPIYGAIAALMAGDETIGGAATDTNGQFSITIDKSDIQDDIKYQLIINSIGYQRQIILLNKNNLKRKEHIKVEKAIMLDAASLGEIYIIDTSSPNLLDKHNGTNKKFTEEDLNHLAY